MHTCGHGKPIDEFCENCEAMGEIVMGLRNTIKEVEEENVRLRKALVYLNGKLNSAHRKVNKMSEDLYNDIMPERDDR